MLSTQNKTWPIFNTKRPRYLCVMQIVCCVVQCFTLALVCLSLISQIIEPLARPWARPTHFCKQGSDPPESFSQPVTQLKCLDSCFFPVWPILPVFGLRIYSWWKDMISYIHVVHSQRFVSFTFTFIRMWVKTRRVFFQTVGIGRGALYYFVCFWKY